MCTLRNFPNQIEHCIEWGRDKFNELFVDTPGDLTSYLDNPQLFVSQLKANSTSAGAVTSLGRMLEFIEMKNDNSFDKCVAMARDQFNSYYDYQIRDLLSVFPIDHKDKSGQPFWSGPKRAPSPITFDLSNPTHLNFVVCYANLIAVALGIPENRDAKAVASISEKVPIKPYEPKKVEVEEGKENESKSLTPDDEVLIERFLARIEKVSAEIKKE